MAVTSNLLIPLLTGNTLVMKNAINAALNQIDQAALSKEHLRSGGHWATWEKEKAFSDGDVIRTDDCYSWGYLQCTTAGTSGTMAPACPYGEGDTVTDGKAVWTLKKLGGSVKHGDLTGRALPDQHPITAITGLKDELDSKENPDHKGKANGYAGLNASGYVPMSQLPPNIKEMRVVANIAARNAITGTDLYDGLQVHVIDATGDSTVTSGWAEYIYDDTSSSWIKRAEKESLDLILDWANVQHIPDVLKKLSVTDGKLFYNGSAVYQDYRTVVFVGGDAECVYSWGGTIQKIMVSCSEPQAAALIFNVEVQSKADYVAQANNWQLVGGSQLSLDANTSYQEYIPTNTNLSISAGDVLRASTAGDDTGITFHVIIKNN